MILTLFAACAKTPQEQEWEPPKKDEPSQGTSDESEPDEAGENKSIDFVLMGYGATGQPQNKKLIEAVCEELNGRLLKGINAEVKFNWVPYSTYAESVLEMIASEDGIDAVDMMYAGSAVYRELHEGDMLMDIKNDFKIYMPSTYKFLHEKYAYIDDYLLTDGAQYVIPRIDAYPVRSYIITQKELYRKYGENITTLQDYGQYMKWLSSNAPDITPGYAQAMEVIDAYLMGHGYCTGFATSIYGHLESITEPIPMERIPEFRDAYELLKIWNENNYQGKIRTGGQYQAAQNGNLASMLINPHFMQSDVRDAIKLPANVEYECIVLYPETMMMNIPSFDGLAILKDADAAPETLMFYELIYTDQYYYDMLQYGIEGENYTKIGEKLTIAEESGKAIKGWDGSDNFYNYSMERPLWAEPDDYASFFEAIAFDNTVNAKQLEAEQDIEYGALDEQTTKEINAMYEDGIYPLLDIRFDAYGEFVNKLDMGDYSMTADEAIEMIGEGNAQELIDTYAAIMELQHPSD
jgi:putative aldouronate transport system substrate-binding protein